YRTGQTEFSFSEETRKRLRTYLVRGGTLILEATGGRPGFARSAYAELQKLFPDRPPYRLTLDHPLYHSYYDMKTINYRPAALRSGARNGVPSAIGIDIECRTAVFFFRYDLSCGWDNQLEKTRPICIGYDIPTARMLGANLMAYISSERNAAIPLSKALEYHDATPQKAGKFVIAQAIYHGIWKTRTSALNMLLNVFHEKTKVPVRFRREEVPLDSPKLFDSPMIFMTGHHAFSLTQAEVQNLRNFILRGGTLLAEACCGRHDFDINFRKAIRVMFPERTLKQVPLDHIIFNFPNKITEVSPSPALARSLKASSKIAPHLEAIEIDGRLAVIYSPYGLSCGWEMAQCPYGREIQSTDALALGVNILNYILLH
ncbi:MAG: DUF4159 domain-containing protein, partial [Lentisphaerae bacterium]